MTTNPTNDPANTVRAVQITEDADWEAIAAWCGGELINHAGLVELRLKPSGLVAAAGDWIVHNDYGGVHVVSGSCWPFGQPTAAPVDDPETHIRVGALRATIRQLQAERDAARTEAARLTRERDALSGMLRGMARHATSRSRECRRLANTYKNRTQAYVTVTDAVEGVQPYERSEVTAERIRATQAAVARLTRELGEATAEAERQSCLVQQARRVACHYADKVTQLTRALSVANRTLERQETRPAIPAEAEDLAWSACMDDDKFYSLNSDEIMEVIRRTLMAIAPAAPVSSSTVPADVEELRQQLLDWAAVLVRGGGVVVPADIAWKLRQLAGSNTAASEPKREWQDTAGIVWQEVRPGYVTPLGNDSVPLTFFTPVPLDKVDARYGPLSECDGGADRPVGPDGGTA